MYKEVHISDAREEFSRFGMIDGEMNPRDDGGWDAVVITDDGEELLMSIAYDDDGDNLELMVA